MIYVFTPAETDNRVAEAFDAVGAAGSARTYPSSAYPQIKDSLVQGDTAVFTEAASSGRRYEDVLENIKFLSAREVVILFVKEQIMIDPKSPPPVYIAADISLKIYKSLLSRKNKTIQENLLKAGRPRGAPRRSREKLASMHDEIERRLKSGESAAQIAKTAGCSRSSLYRYMRNSKPEGSPS